MRGNSEIESHGDLESAEEEKEEKESEWVIWANRGENKIGSQKPLHEAPSPTMVGAIMRTVSISLAFALFFQTHGCVDSSPAHASKLLQTTMWGDTKKQNKNYGKQINI